ncbi:restriction endonuclease subunit S [Pseudomonas aeruginosa]|uniref:restriction endonuclease subunit S n=1 Tax=Pseudomonas aeruginosa TaxID=287 RepID=UPI003CF3B374
MSHYKPYPAYKDSGVEWLGRVPEHWQLRRLKHMARFSGGGTPARDNPEFWSGDIPWVSPKDMKSELITGAEECITAAGLSGSSSSMVPAERVLMVVRSGILKHTIPVAINSVPVALNQDMKAIWLDTDYLSSPFFMRWVQGLNDDLLKVWLKQGATVESIEQDYLSDTLIPVPPVSEREQIVQRLDRETARIDALIEKKTRFIELLREKRQALITHAVTKGLDPNVKMKDSGVEWLGEVPEHWEALPLRRVVTAVKTGGTPSEEQPAPDADGLAWYTPGDFGSSLVLTSSEKRVSALAVSTGEAKVYPAGSVLVVSIGATLGKVGYIADPASANQQINAVIPSSRVNGYFLAYSLSVKTEAMWFLANAATIGIMNQEKTKEIWLAVPSQVEQETITQYLDKGTGRLDSLIGKTERSIELLKERRSALITAAVTGQIDLREAV